jgi:hypothetical protein
LFHVVRSQLCCNLLKWHVHLWPRLQVPWEFIK